MKPIRFARGTPAKEMLARRRAGRVDPAHYEVVARDGGAARFADDAVLFGTASRIAMSIGLSGRIAHLRGAARCGMRYSGPSEPAQQPLYDLDKSDGRH